jgi:hypothetical protein
MWLIYVFTDTNGKGGLGVGSWMRTNKPIPGVGNNTTIIFFLLSRSAKAIRYVYWLQLPIN